MISNSKGLAEYGQQMLRESTGVGQDVFQANNIANQIEQQQLADQERQGTSAQFQKFLQTMGMMAANRGVNKALETPAQMNGVNPYNKRLFGVEPKQAVPYQKVLLDQQNLDAVLKGYQEVKNQRGGPSAKDTANLIANMQRSEALISSSLKKVQQPSIFEGVPKSAATNLYNIGLKNQRENSLYALV